MNWSTLTLPCLIPAMLMSTSLSGNAADRESNVAESPTLRDADKSTSRLTIRKLSGPEPAGAVLGLGAPDSFDARWVSCPSALYDGKAYQMWYSSVFDSRMGRGGIGLATSADGLKWQRQNQGAPVLSPGPEGSLDDGQVLGCEVLHDGRQYRMWYTGSSRNWHESGICYYRIFLASSSDGIQWQRENSGRPVLDVGPAGSHDEVQAATPSILRTDNGYRMWYAAWSPQHNHTICAATSVDGLRWTRDSEGKPVTGLNPSIAYGPAICRWNNRYLMLYMALAATRGLYGAESRDGVRWSMLNDGEPLLAPGSPGDFDSDIVGHPFLLPQDGKLRLWYTGYQRDKQGVRGLLLRVGMAEGM